MSNELKPCPHEYGPSHVGHGEAQCKWCYGTNRENAILAPNNCDVRATKDPLYTRPPADTEPAPGLPHLAACIAQIGRPETLDDAIAERDAWIESAAQFSRNEDYYRGLLDGIAGNFGQDAYVADDGSVSQDPLRAKVPELVAARIQSDAVELARLRAAVKPFADCCEWISADESDEEWAKFRLLVKDYRRARAALGTAGEG